MVKISYIDYNANFIFVWVFIAEVNCGLRCDKLANEFGIQFDRILTLFQPSDCMELKCVEGSISQAIVSYMTLTEMKHVWSEV